MSWRLYRWVWELKAPLSIGMAPAGALNRCHLYVPARAIWGAVTAELARHNASGFPDYRNTGERVRDQARFTYLFPGERTNGGWRAWLPRYAEGDGLAWRRERSAVDANGSVPDRQFRRWLLDARSATAIDPDSDSAAESSLRETECLMASWRSRSPSPEGPVGLIGYVFVRPGFQEEINRIDTLFLGGDTRYGLGCVQCLEWECATHVFGAEVEIASGTGAADPIIRTETVLGHSPVDDGESGTIGAVEPIVGWDRTTSVGLTRVSDLAWLPGSRTSIDGRVPSWAIDPSGCWKHFS